MYIIDAAEFKVLFKKHFNKVFGICKVITGNIDACQDIVTDSFMKLWDRREKFNDVKHAENFLYRTTVNAAKNFLLKKRYITRGLDDVEQTEDPPPDEISKRTIAQSYAAVEQLPPKCKLIFKMKVYEGMTFYQICDALKMKHHAVYIRYLSAVKLLLKNVTLTYE